MWVVSLGERLLLLGQPHMAQTCPQLSPIQSSKRDPNSVAGLALELAGLVILTKSRH